MSDTENRDDQGDEAADTPPSDPPETSQPAVTERRLVRSRDDRVIAGVCGGLGRYLEVDPVLVRIATLLLVFAGGAGAVLYVIGWIAIPEEPAVLGSVPLERARDEPGLDRGGAFALGIVFVALGVFFLVDAVWADFLSWKYLWPIALMAVGAAILLRSRR